MRSPAVLWIVAILLTLFLARHQRVTGPTYPMNGRATLGASTFAWTLERTHAGPGDQRVTIRPGAAGASAMLEYRLHGGDTAWASVEMRRDGDALVADLPHQPVAGKLDYRVAVRSGDVAVTLPPAGFATTRFRNDVPAWVLIPHVAFMFGAMLLSNRAGLEVLRPQPKFVGLANATLIALFVGGFPLGFAMSGYAFGEPWGGFPLGNDPTDNKTLVAFAGWIAAWIALRTTRAVKPMVVLAALLMLIVYLIPHSLAAPK